MYRWVWWGVLGSAIAGVQVSAVAQERIYRCGNTYTNHVTAAKQRGCQVMQAGAVTVVQTAVAAKAGAAPAASDRRAAGAELIDPQQQKVRDNDARAILQAELDKAQTKLQALQLEFNAGNPTKTALELRNPQVLEARVTALQAQIARQEKDVASIQRELARHSGR